MGIKKILKEINSIIDRANFVNCVTNVTRVKIEKKIVK